LRKKLKVFKKFKEFKSIVENQTNNKTKVLRTENSGEFCGKLFDQLRKKCGIACKNTKPYTPKENGFSKRMNRKLMDKARIMLNGVGLAHELWA
jgi:hypothetical protein